MFQEDVETKFKLVATVTIPAKYKGPPAIANGGYVCGLLAAYIKGAADVMIKLPTPLDKKLQIFANGDGSYYLMLVKAGYYEWHAIEYGNPTVSGGSGSVSASLLAKFSTGTNVALQSQGATATASSYGSYGGYNATADQANDGQDNSSNPNTMSFWGASSVPAWLMITLPSVKSIKTIVVNQNYHDITFNIEGSTDGSTWFTLVPSTFLTHTAGVYTLSSATNVKQVRLNITNTTAPGSHVWQANIQELELWQY